MRKFLLAAVISVLALAKASAGTYYTLTQNASSATMRVAGEIQISNPLLPFTSTITISGGGGGGLINIPTGQIIGGVFSGTVLGTLTGSLGTVATMGISLGPITGTSLNQFDYVYAQSFDGASQSSGCVVAINVGNGNNATSNFLTFTSTTSQTNVSWYGVLMDNNVLPGQQGRIAIRGLVRMQSNASQTVGQNIQPAATRCQGVSIGTFVQQGFGHYMAADGTTWATVWLGAGGR